MSYTSAVSHCGNDHLQWVKNIDFYKDDLKVLTMRLEEIVKKNSKQDVLAEAAHFQNQFIIQRDNIDQLRHTISHHSDKVAIDSKDHAGKIKTILVIEHEDVQKKMDELESQFQNTRKEFNKFLSKWM